MAGDNIFHDLLMYLISRMPLSGLFILQNLHFQNARRAEYLADAMAAQVAGTDAMVGVLEKLYFRPIYGHLMRRVMAASGGQLDFFGAFRGRAEALTPDDAARIAERERLELEDDPTTTHPPLSYRLELLRASSVKKPKIVITDSNSERIDRELAPMREWCSARYKQLI